MTGNNDIEREVAEKVRKALDRSVADLDGRTVEGLRRARMAAVAAAETEKPPWFAVHRWLTAGGVAAFAVLVVAVSLWFVVPGRNQTVAQVEDMDILASNEHMEIYEDMDFYQWLAADQNTH
ncbi:MAG TPA: DUF3619 family protein [Geobacteraceae bacterium]|nr:DUF3619 family protein [Geobacteraceae bacterium]